jgi:hypothetical protein
MMSHTGVALLCQQLDVLVEGFFGTTVYVGVKAEILVALVRLRIISSKGVHLFLVDAHGISVNPGLELVEGFGVVVFADACVQAVVPTMNAADEVLTFDVAIRHECSSVQTPAVEHRNGVSKPNDDEVHVVH